MDSIPFPALDPALRRARLDLPTELVDAVLDTDTFNEVDDQFALTYALLATAPLRLRAVTAAPFLHSRSTSPAAASRFNALFTVLILTPNSFASCTAGGNVSPTFPSVIRRFSSVNNFSWHEVNILPLINDCLFFLLLPYN